MPKLTNRAIKASLLKYGEIMSKVENTIFKRIFMSTKRIYLYCDMTIDFRFIYVQ